MNVILQQRDPAGSPAALGLTRAFAKLEAQGIEVFLAPPPAWRGIKDLNDTLRALTS